MLCGVIIWSAALLPFVAGKAPRETYCKASDLNQHAYFPPQPTKGPKLELARRQLQKRALYNTCGYFQDDEEATCGGNQYCAYITNYWGCCGVNAAGSFTNCVIDTACVDYASLSVACPSGCPAQVGYCQSDHPYCALNLLEGTLADGSLWTSTSYGCVVTPTTFILSPSPVITSSYSQASSQQPQPPLATSVSVSTQATVTTYTSAVVTSSDGEVLTTSSAVETSTSAVVVISNTATIEVPTSSAGPQTSYTTEVVAPTGGSETTSATSSTGTPQQGNQGPNATTSHNHTGAIVGGVVGGILGLALLVFIGWFVTKRITNRSRSDTPEVSQYSYYAE